MLLDRITPIDVHIAAKLREIRLVAGLTQEKLGELVGITFQQVQKYEKAKNRICASRLFEFSQILERPLEAFFEGLEADRSYYNYDFKTPKKQKKELQKFDKELLPLIRAFNRIESPQAKKHLVALANSIAKAKDKKIKHSYS
ncbi:MAG: helix-turn-helix transcriptional regulator [Rickettsiales bacterium]|nr:helix-turn-helix transcriptional regulator [Rickettsiales bacterium]